MMYIFSSTNQTCVLKLWQGTKILHVKDIFHDMENFQDMKAWYKNLFKFM